MLLSEALEYRTHLIALIKSTEGVLALVGDTPAHSYMRADVVMSKFVDGLTSAQLRDWIQKLEAESAALNIAIQQTNYSNCIESTGRTIAESLSIRKSMNAEIAKLQQRLQASAVIRIIHKESKEVPITPEESYDAVRSVLFDLRKEFFKLNCMLRRVQEKTIVNFEPTLDFV